MLANLPTSLLHQSVTFNCVNFKSLKSRKWAERSQAKKQNYMNQEDYVMHYAQSS